VGGTVSISGTNVIFTPTANFNGTASFDYTVQDNGTTNGVDDFKTDVGSVSFTITEVNDAPVATNDTLSAIRINAGARTISFAELLANDSRGPANESGQALTITGVGNAIGGTVSISGTNVIFTPTANFNGTASFDYTVQDNGTTNGVADPRTATGRVSFAINRATTSNDFNGDGREDLLWRNYQTGENAIWFTDGTRIIGGNNFTRVADTNWIIADSGDFNGDGRSDILWRNKLTGQNAIWFMNGLNGSGDVFSTVDKSFVVADVADFNGDGKADILWRNYSSDETIIWLMNGNQVIGTGALTKPGRSWTLVDAADFNGDGKADVAWRNRDTGENAIWLIDGVRAVGGGDITRVQDRNWTIIDAGDFDGDGKADLAWRNLATGQFTIWLGGYANWIVPSSGSGSGGGGGAIQTGPSPQWQLVNVRDYNGDGKADFLWRNYTTGENAIWLLNGAQVTAANNVTPLPDRNWVLVDHNDFDIDFPV
jgi:hypothetical protein